jgi:hypothetical protein
MTRRFIMSRFLRFILASYAPMAARYALLDGRRAQGRSDDGSPASAQDPCAESDACVDFDRAGGTVHYPPRAVENPIALAA